MQSQALRSKYEFHLDPTGQQPGLWNLYTQLTFCYRLKDDSSQDRIVQTLRQGLQRLTTSFPWIAGQVVKRASPDPERSEYYIIKAFEPTSKFIVKDLSGVLPSFDTYTTSSFPTSILDENVIAPRNTKPAPDEADPKPVFLLQATFVTGGLLLTLVAQHGTMDIVGQGEMIRLLSQACHGTPFTDDEVMLGNCDRRTTVPLLDDSEQQHTQEGAKQTAQTPGRLRTTSSEADNTPHTNIWAYFSFSPSSLQSLKSTAVNSTTLTTNFISTDDTLSAFIWQRITHARTPRYSSPTTTTSTFARTVDVRRYLNIFPTYPGNLATKTFTTLTLHQLTSQPLGAIASMLRQGIDPKTSNLAYEARAAATALSSPSNEQTSTKKKSRDLARDIAFSSWAKLTYCYELDFNLGLGQPVAVRRPTFAPDGEDPMEGVVYLMPKRGNGEIAVMICLRDQDMHRLREDALWSRYAEYIG